MPHYAPPPGAPPESHYNPPPGDPPSGGHYAPPSLPPPPQLQPADSFDSAVPSDPPPAYTEDAPPNAHSPPPSAQPQTTPNVGQINFITLPIQPGSALTDSTHKPLDPPPECFSTPSPFRIHSHSFPPFRLPSIDASIGSGFQPLYPADLLGPHGITADDWAQFLRDLGVAARLASRGVSAVAPNRAGRAPMTVSGGFGVLSGPRAVAGGPYDAAFARTPVDEVKALIDVWNGSAFERRKLKVSLHVRSEEGGTRRQGYDLFVEAL